MATPRDRPTHPVPAVKTYRGASAIAAPSAPELTRYELFIGGEWMPAKSGQTFESRNPFSGEVWAEVPAASAIDVDRAVRAAQAALLGWSKTYGRERARLMRRLAEMVAENADQLARTETRDNGKVIREMLGQVKSIPDYFNYWAGWADKIQGDVIPVDKPDMFHYVLREPIGVIAALIPWNSPLLLLVWTLAPALATGNVVVAKPSEHASTSMLEFAKIFERVGFPKGVFSVVTGFGNPTGAALAAHPGVNKVVFTGGLHAARSISVAAAENLIPVTLELGGKSPNIVFGDANLDNAVSGALAGIFGASGQTCIAGSRLLLQDTIADPFIAQLVERTRAIRLGDPQEPSTEMGPVCFKEHLENIHSFVTDALRDGARLATGGKRATHGTLTRGYFYEPTILTEVRRDMRVARDEVFGPVLSVFRFGDEEEALRVANDSEFGLAAGVWTTDLSRAHRMAQRLQSGIVWINTYRAASYAASWGGVKKSGHGRELGPEAIHEFTQVKSVWVDLSGKTADPFALR